MMTAASITTQMSNVDNVDTNLPPAPSRSERQRRTRTLIWGALGSFVAVVAAVLIAASIITVPYVIIAPGQTYVANRLVSVSGSNMSYPATGEIRFVTVSERVDPTLLDKLQADHNGDDQVLPRDEILGNQTRQQNDAANQAAMASSKDTAALVALRKLGYDVPSDVLITEIVPGTPAATFAKEGDVIAAIDGEVITSTGELRSVLGGHTPGDVVTVELVDPQAVHRTAQVALADNPDNPGHAFLGVGLGDRPKLPFQINIDTSQVGGPSAGLAFTLAILEVLTPGELTGGQVVAATGTIDSDGHVGAIGGIQQKVVTVLHEGVKVFLVPADDNCGNGGSCNYSEAKAKAGDRLQIIPVATLDQALEALSSLGGNALALGEPGKAPTS
jgi:PDZ domain-containing protein